MSTLFCKRVMDGFRREMRGKILPNNCYVNAVIAAKWLQERGFDVEIVEGVMTVNDKAEAIAKKYGCSGVRSQKHDYLNEAPLEHRFCRKGDKYFDPTMDFLYGFGFAQGFDYKAIRVYDVDTIITFALQSKETYGEVHFHNSINGLTYVYKGEEDIPLIWYYIDDDGYLVMPDYNPFERRAEILAA